MKNRFVKSLSIILVLIMILAVFVACGQGKEGPAGAKGDKGEQGEPGINGTNGVDGKSAYELAVDKGYIGTVEEWLASLVGEAGAKGQNGANGQSAYEIAVKNGYIGTETEWLASLVGASGSNGSNGINGTNGKSAYELACDNGFNGSLSEWLDSLVGKDGTNGINGSNGINGKSAYELACDNGFEGTLTEWLASLVGKDGSAAAKGEDGKSAYELAVENGYRGDMQSWLASLVGTKGKDGVDGGSAYEIAVANGYKGTETEWLASLVGAKGADGKNGTDGKTPYIKEGYWWIGDSNTNVKAEGVNGNNGQAGTDGVSVVNAYVDESLHLWIVLSNGTQIDAGYVGVTTTDPKPATYTVTFVDYNGTVLKTEIVESGSSATPPIAPNREGYEFKSWSGIYTNVTSNQTVTAVYEEIAVGDKYTVTFVDYDGTTIASKAVNSGATAELPTNPSKSGVTFLGWSGNYVNVTKNEIVTAVYSDTQNVFVVESTSGSIGDTITVLVSVDGSVKTCGFDFTLFYDDSLELVSYDDDLDVSIIVNDSLYANGIKLNFSDAKDKTKQRDIIELTFKIKDTTKSDLPIWIDMKEVFEVMSGGTIENASYAIINGVVKLQ